MTLPEVDWPLPQEGASRREHRQPFLPIRECEVATEYKCPDDHELIVTSDPDAHLPTTRCYIESKTGAEFSVDVEVTRHLVLPRHHDCIVTNMYIDGTWTYSLAGTFQKRTRSPITLTHWAKGGVTEPNGQIVFKKFVFTAITRTDTATNEKADRDATRSRGLGTIKIIFESGRRGSESVYIPQVFPEDESFDFAEKALKGRELSHGASLVASNKVAGQVMSWNITERSRIGVFCFHYRSHDTEALQHEMIIPRTPSLEVQPEVAGDLSHLSGEEIRRLARERLRDVQIKQEREAGVKREADYSPTPPPRPLKVIRLDNGKEAFDLTED
ncbi:hypothetical protein FZEAL_9806 [Fusarium zealandicum]|uniref:DUF7918 domain-containing protein n=1 Tax=Fusarium zealandicum TaxID=1053134 RepID=A0A8H4XEM7_9HYPO|nr:hypothetical protein FZEAL_9806 [Fusarium zealandicum]